MLTVSLHGIHIFALKGLYAQEKIDGNNFVVDVDVFLSDGNRHEFVDYTIIRQIVGDVFDAPGDLLETLVFDIHKEIKERFPIAEKIKVAVRKLHPPMPGSVDHAQVCYEA